MPTQHMLIMSGDSSQIPTSVNSSATSQKYKKLVGP